MNRLSLSRRAWCLVFCALLIGVPSLGYAIEILNPGFEEASTSATPPHWRAGTPDTVATLDKAEKHTGDWSLSITPKGAGRFASMVQTIDVRQAQGKLIKLSAWVKAQGVTGSPPGIWLRSIPKNDEPAQFAGSYAKPIVGDMDWALRESTYYFVSPNDIQLTVGVNIAGGRIWVDDLKIEAFALDQKIPLSAIADSYLQEALAAIKQKALNAKQVDWVLMEKAARIIAANASTTADVYPAISFLLAQLKDNHSYLVLPQRVSALTDPLDEKARKALQQGVKPLGNLAYVEVPGFSQGRNPGSVQAYIDALTEGMREAALKKPCGWVVDARRNTGGGMHPMLAALIPLLGDEVLGYFVDAAEKRPLSIQEGAFRMTDGYSYKASKPLADDTLKTLPVALLSGPQTASAGEIVLVAFQGRPDTRMFGQPTSGRTSANTTVNLSDGAALAITSARLADRSGKIYAGRLMPDEVVEPSADPAEDKVLAAALAWLKRQPACSKVTN